MTNPELFFVAFFVFLCVVLLIIAKFTFIIEELRLLLKQKNMTINKLSADLELLRKLDLKSRLDKE